MATHLRTGSPLKAGEIAGFEHERLQVNTLVSLPLLSGDTTFSRLVIPKKVSKPTIFCSVYSFSLGPDTDQLQYPEPASVPIPQNLLKT